MTDQQFCLRWNNHQSTLVAVFDGLLEKGVLVDCTLAAEGQQLTAHKVVLAACSPFLETLLSRHYDKHPILILKDVKFSELKAMMDYMYRGEVNISQDQLGTFLKAAESLQIKGLSDGGGGNEKNVDTNSNKRHHDRKLHRPNSPLRNSLLSDSKRVPYLHNSIKTPAKSSPLLVDIPEDSPINRSRDGSMSPVPRKKKRPREDENVNVNLNLNNTCKTSESIPPSHETVNNHQENSSNSVDLSNSMSVPPVPSPNEVKPQVTEPTADKTDPMAHLKHEMIEEEEDINEDSMELTLEEEEELGEAGPSHNEGEFGEFFSGSQDGDHRDGQGEFTIGGRGQLMLGNKPVDGSQIAELPWPPANQKLSIRRLLGAHVCQNCNRVYSSKATLTRHLRAECGIGSRIQCPYCPHKAKRSDHLLVHIKKIHKEYNNH